MLKLNCSYYLENRISEVLSEYYKREGPEYSLHWLFKSKCLFNFVRLFACFPTYFNCIILCTDQVLSVKTNCKSG